MLFEMNYVILYDILVYNIFYLLFLYFIMYSLSFIFLFLCCLSINLSMLIQDVLCTQVEHIPLLKINQFIFQICLCLYGL